MVDVKTQKITRDKLAKFFGGNLEMINLIENVTRDVGSTLPAASEQNAADAASAQSTADTAQAGVVTLTDVTNGLMAPDYLVLTPQSLLSNERQLTVDARSLQLADSGPGGTVVIGSADLIAVATSDVSNASTTFVSAGLSVTLSASSTYILDALVTIQSAATTTGVALALTLPVGASVSGYFRHPITATTMEGSYNLSDSTSVGVTSGVRAAAESIPVEGRWTVTTGVNPGPVTLLFKSEVTASAITVKANLSNLIARRIL